jgi:hypothetical protein
MEDSDEDHDPALSLGVGAAYAQGVPAGYQGPHYGAQAKG